MKFNGILCLTHSSRVTDITRCSINAFTRRYSDPLRLKRLPPFHTLRPEKDYLAYFGALSIYNVHGDQEALHLKCLSMLRDKHKIQHAILFDHETIAILYESFLKIVKFDYSKPKTFKLERIVEHPLFAGLHSIEKTHNNTLLISASAADSVLEISISGKLERTLPMPKEYYGEGYKITHKTDLHKHYIANDYQTTHINMASMTKDKKYILVSALIPGAIGRFNYETEEYDEITRGFLGCHGCREASDGRIYFSDSVNGNIVFLNKKNQVAERYGVRSRWLHDAVEISPRIFSFTLSDSNSLEILNLDTGRKLYRKKYPKYPNRIIEKLMCAINKNWLGNSTQFLSFKSYDV